MIRSFRNWLLLMAALVSGCTHASKRNPADFNAAGTADIDPSAYSQILVISDVHGMYDNLVRLLQSSGTVDGNLNWAAGRTLFIVIGDSIDKGPKSLSVLDLWMKLQPQAQAAGGRLVHLLGNHEAEFLANPYSDPKSDLLAELKAQGLTPAEVTDPRSPRAAFIMSEPVAAKVGVWLFCHAGRFPKMHWSDIGVRASQLITAHDYADPFFIGNESILEAKDWEKHAHHLKDAQDRMESEGFYGVVFGHQPDAFHIPGRSAAMAGGRFIKIDNGMAPEAGAHPGSLLRFTQPTQLSDMGFPSVEVISPTGDRKALKPESGAI